MYGMKLVNISGTKTSESKTDLETSRARMFEVLWHNCI
jgi:hypothetical protein